jgi:hypothetical protein
MGAMGGMPMWRPGSSQTRILSFSLTFRRHADSWNAWYARNADDGHARYASWYAYARNASWHAWHGSATDDGNAAWNDAWHATWNDAWHATWHATWHDARNATWHDGWAWNASKHKRSSYAAWACVWCAVHAAWSWRSEHGTAN